MRSKTMATLNGVAAACCGLALLAGAACDDGGNSAGGTADATTSSPDAPVRLPDAATPALDASIDGGVALAELALHYQFEDLGAVVSDSSGRELHGMLSDIAAWTTQGRVGNGLSLSADGSQYVELPGGILDGVGDFTIAVWVKLETVGPWSRIYDIGNGLPDPANRFMYLTPSGINGIHAASYGGSPANESVVIAGTQLPTGVWKHVAIAGSGGERTLYVDGYPIAHVSDGPVVLPSEMEPIAGQSWLGKSRFGADPGLDGTMDEFRVYTRRLTQTEIADLAWPQQDYAYWRFDENSGGTTVDSSDHGIGTSLVDGASWEANGRLGAALDLSGAPAGAAGPHVVLGANPLAGCTTELTVSAWIKLRSLDSWARVFDFGSADRFIYLSPYDGDGKVRFAMVAPTGVLDVVSDAPLLAANDAWHHVAVTVAQDGAVVLYVDGAVAQSATSPGVSPGDFSSLTDLWLGKSRFPDPYLNGSIDELRIGCRALSADEITNLSRP